MSFLLTDAVTKLNGKAAASSQEIARTLKSGVVNNKNSFNKVKLNPQRCDEFCKKTNHDFKGIAEKARNFERKEAFRIAHEKYPNDPFAAWDAALDMYLKSTQK